MSRRAFKMVLFRMCLLISAKFCLMPIRHRIAGSPACPVLPPKQRKVQLFPQAVPPPPRSIARPRPLLLKAKSHLVNAPEAACSCSSWLVLPCWTQSHVSPQKNAVGPPVLTESLSCEWMLGLRHSPLSGSFQNWPEDQSDAWKLPNAERWSPTLWITSVPLFFQELFFPLYQDLVQWVTRSG